MLNKPQDIHKLQLFLLQGSYILHAKVYIQVMRSYGSFEQPLEKHGHCRRNCFSKPTSKSVVQVLLWTIVVGFIYSTVNASSSSALSTLHFDHDQTLRAVVCLYIALALAMMCYPLGGIVADVYVGRYKTIIASLILMALSMLVALITLVATIQLGVNENSHTWKKTLYALGGSSVCFLLAIGLAGFTSNIVQFGLDQLLDAPSNKLGAFVHLYVWANRIGLTGFDTVYVIKQCYSGDISIAHDLMYALPAGIFTVLSAMVWFNCATHRTFNKERVKYNPYKTLLRVLNFARKHKSPVGHPSAFAYCDEFRPSRMDYAKERYGGPFTTSDVEDVKTVTRLLIMLLTLGPVFAIVVPTYYELFATFALYNGTPALVGNGYCSAEWVLLQSGLLSDVVSTLVLPFYTWILFSLLSRKNKLPKSLHRVQLAAMLFVFSLVYMLAVDVTGHALESNARENNTCVFFKPNLLDETLLEPLHLHWTALIFPNLTKALALDLIMASAFEFISAQSPYTMKGVLVGLLFAVRGFFQLIAAVVLLPVTIKSNRIWSKVKISCLTSFYSVTLAISLLGIILFTIAARKYQYRKREEEPYSQSRVEEIYDRMLRDREARLTSRITTLHRLERNIEHENSD